MAETIPRDQWSEAETQQARLFYWEYLVSRWLVPGPAVLRTDSEDVPSGDPRGGASLYDYGWIFEPDTLAEQ